MDDPVKITNTDWSELKHQADLNAKDIGYLTGRVEGHASKLVKLEEGFLMFPMSIKEAVQDGMAPVLITVMDHTEKFNQLALTKEREDKERLQRMLDQEADRKKWFIRTVIATIVGGIVGPAITMVGFIFFNN